MTCELEKAVYGTAWAARMRLWITNNGKPRALMIDVDEDNFDETLKAVRQARAIMAFAKMRRKASEEGYMTPEEIDAEIAAARREKKGEQG